MAKQSKKGPVRPKPLPFSWNNTLSFNDNLCQKLEYVARNGATRKQRVAALELLDMDLEFMGDDWFKGVGRYLIDCEPGQELLPMGREKALLMVADDVGGREFTEYIFVDEDHRPHKINARTKGEAYLAALDKTDGWRDINWFNTADEFEGNADCWMGNLHLLDDITTLNVPSLGQTKSALKR